MASLRGGEGSFKGVLKGIYKGLGSVGLGFRVFRVLGFRVEG